MTSSDKSNESLEDAHSALENGDRDYEDRKLVSALKYYKYAKDSLHDFWNMKGEYVALLRLSRLYEDLLERCQRQFRLRKEPNNYLLKLELRL